MAKSRISKSRISELKRRFDQESLKIKLGLCLNKLLSGYAVVTMMPIAPDLLIIEGVVQGGILTAVADFAGVYAAMSYIPSGHTPAGQIIIDLIRPIKPDEIVKAVGRVIIETRSTIWSEVEVYGMEDVKRDKLRAHAVIRFVKPKPLAD